VKFKELHDKNKGLITFQKAQLFEEEISEIINMSSNGSLFDEISE
jgi:hypothetical protein